MSASRSRIEYLDVIKAIAISLVVFCHFPKLNDASLVGNLLMTLAWAAVPCFFLVTGGLLHRSETFDLKKYGKRLLRIYLIYVVWKALYLVYSALGMHISLTKAGLFNYLFLFGTLENVDTKSLWFMEAYLTVLVLYPVTQFLFHHGTDGRKILAAFGGVFAVSEFLLPGLIFVFGWLAETTGHNMPDLEPFRNLLPLTTYGNMVFFFIAGAYLFAYRDAIISWLHKSLGHRLLPVLLLVLGLADLLLLKWMQCGSFRWEGYYLNAGYGYNYFGTLVLSLGLYLLLFQIQKSTPLTRFLAGAVGVNTMGVYFLHYPLLHTITTVLGDTLAPYASLWLNLVQCVVVLAVCCVLTWILKKIPVIRHLVI